ncbi:HD domain-containing protein, partial [bacterium]
VEHDAHQFASAFKEKIKGVLIILDEAEKIYRVVKKIDSGIFNFDFGELRGNNLEEDLKQRDFTINALVWKVSPELDFDNIVDLIGGYKDLKNKSVRMIDSSAFDGDPLRLLRAFRIAAQYSFNIDSVTYEEIKKKKELINNSSSERIHDELIKLLNVPNSFDYIEHLDNSGLLEQIFEEISSMKQADDYYFHPKGLWGHSKEVLYCFEFILKNLNKLLPQELYEYCINYLHTNNRLSCLKLVCLFHDIGKPECFSIQDKVRFFGHDILSAKYINEIMKRLRFSNRDINFAKKTTAFHMYAGNLAKQDQITDRACYRYFRRTEESSISILLFTMADWLASIRGADNISYKSGIKEDEFKYKDFSLLLNAVKRIISWYIEAKKTVKLERLVTGHDIMKNFGLKPGNIIGQILDAVQEAQAEGAVTSREQVLEFVKRWLIKNKDKNETC